MTRPAIHTIPHDGAWANRHDGASRVSRKIATKAEAEQAARTTAQRERLEHHNHRADSEVTEKNSYGNDPRALPG